MESESVDRQAGSGGLPDEEIESLGKRVSAAVRRHCPSWLSAQVEDIAQNVLVKLLKKSGQAEGNRTFSALYLEKSVYGAVVDEIRRAGRRKETAVDDAVLENRTESCGAGPDRASYSVEIARGILACLGGLSRSRKLAVTLYLHGCTVPETASRLRWHLKRTESHFYRGLADLRACLDRRGLKP